MLKVSSPGAGEFKLNGPLDESCEQPLSDLSKSVAGEKKIQLDVSGVTHINSIGGRHWVMFLEGLHPEQVELYGCTVAFVSYCNISKNFYGSAI